MHAWKRFRRLGASERRLVLGAAVALTTAWLALRLVGFRRASALLATPVTRSSDAARATEALPDSGTLRHPPEEIARLTHSTARSLPFACNCLERSLALCWLLGRRGIEARLRIGARKDGSQLKAHAWVESAGMALDDAGAEHEHFVPFNGALAPVEKQMP